MLDATFIACQYQYSCRPATMYCSISALLYLYATILVRNCNHIIGSMYYYSYLPLQECHLVVTYEVYFYCI